MYGTGKAEINIQEAVAGALSNWTIIYEAGEYGVDDSGEILIARRDVCDSDIPQFENKWAPGYIKIHGEIDAKLKYRYVPDRYVRPWRSCISIIITDGSLKKGDRIYIQYGCSGCEGTGYRVQTFAEKEHIFKVLIDCGGSGNFYEIDHSPSIIIKGGYASKLDLVAPSMIKPGEMFDLFIRALDSWGNIAEKYNSKTTVTINEIGKDIFIKEGKGSLAGLFFEEDGVYSIGITDEHRNLTGKSNPILCNADSPCEKLYWGDMHGQTKETVGTGTLDEYFSFARDSARLDFCAWQGNDFQVMDETWRNVCHKVREYNEPGRFVTFLGYEWSGTTPVGGDYNIYYLKDDQPIYRSYHWQIDMEKRDGSERSPLTELWKEFDGRDDVMAIPHVGGRYGNLDFWDERFVHLLEIHSHHGTFEWFLEDALKKELRPGILAASDDHTCRPGLSYPTEKTSRGFVSFDVTGGYTGVYASSLTREALWDAFIKRHTYGTTGERIILKVACGDKIMGDEFVVHNPPKIEVEVMGTDVISEVEIKRGLETIYAYSSSLPKKQNTIKIQWSGVRIRSRNKKTNWDGKLYIQNGRFETVRQFAFNRPDEGAFLVSNQVIEWKSNTSGDIDGIEIDLEHEENTKLLFSCVNVSFSFYFKDLKENKIIMQAGGVNQKVEVSLACEETKSNASLCFEDRDIKPGINPYWVRVLQKDGHMAWSSPMYIDYNGV